MIIAGYDFFQGEDEIMSVVLALTLSFVCMFGLVPLDWLADQDWTDAKCDRAIDAIMESMAFCIGFAWEQCFDNSVDALAEASNSFHSNLLNSHTSKMFLSIFCA